MKKEPIYVAFSTQKGGAGKTTLTVFSFAYYCLFFQLDGAMRAKDEYLDDVVVLPVGNFVALPRPPALATAAMLFDVKTVGRIVEHLVAQRTCCVEIIWFHISYCFKK